MIHLTNEMGLRLAAWRAEHGAVERCPDLGAATPTEPEPRERPLFDSPEQVIRVAYQGLPDHCRALPLEPRAGSGVNELDWARANAHRTERYVVASAVLVRARRAGLGAIPVEVEGLGQVGQLELVVLALVVWGLPWHDVAELAQLDDEALTTSGVKSRVYRAFHAGLRAIRGAM